MSPMCNSYTELHRGGTELHRVLFEWGVLGAHGLQIRASNMSEVFLII